MRIAMFTDTFIPNVNGVVTSVLNFSKRLSDHGHKVIIFTSDVKTKQKKIKKIGKNISIKYYKPINLLNYPDFQLTLPNIKIVRELKRFRPDIIHSHMPSLLGWQALVCASAFDIPIAATYHTFLPDFVKHAPFIRKINKKLSNKIVWSYTRGYYNLCDMVVTPSPIMKKELIKFGIKKPIEPISNGVDIPKFTKLPAASLKKEGASFLYVGRISYEKNVNEVVEAFKIAARSCPVARLIIAGDGPDMDKIKACAGTYLGNKIRFLGTVRHDDLPALYSSADIFVTASTIETEGIVILEAMACGLPVIGVDKLAIPCIVSHGRNGLISKAHDVRGMARHMVDLSRDEKKRAQFSRESISLVQAYSLDKTTKKLESLYASMMKKKE